MQTLIACRSTMGLWFRGRQQTRGLSVYFLF